jgi:hypothetical protein
LQIEEVVTTINSVIRTKATKGHDALYGDDSCSTTATGSARSQTYYNVGPTQVGAWTTSVGDGGGGVSSSSTFSLSSPYRTYQLLRIAGSRVIPSQMRLRVRCIPVGRVIPS